MITHIAIFKWKNDVKKSDVKKALEDVSKLKSKIPGTIDVRCGRIYPDMAKGLRMLLW